MRNVFRDACRRDIEAEVQAVAQSDIKAELGLATRCVHSEENVADIGKQILGGIETADRHNLSVDRVDEIRVELEQEFLRRDVDHEVRIVLHRVFDRVDVAAVCGLRLRGFCSVRFVQELAENTLEQSVEVDICHCDFCSVAEDSAEVNVNRIIDEVDAQKRSVGSRTFAVLVEFDAEIYLEFFNVDICNEIECEISTLIVAELVDNVEFERRAADRAVGIDESHHKVEDFAQIDFVCRAFLRSAAVQRNVN